MKVVLKIFHVKSITFAYFFEMTWVKFFEDCKIFNLEDLKNLLETHDFRFHKCVLFFSLCFYLYGYSILLLLYWSKICHLSYIHVKKVFLLNIAEIPLLNVALLGIFQNFKSFSGEKVCSIYLHFFN